MAGMKLTEKEIKAEILGYLGAMGVKAWPNNPGGKAYETRSGVKKYAPHGRPGQADITGLMPDGRRLEIEVKVPGERPRADQWEYLLMVQRSHGVAFWTDTAAYVREVMHRLIEGEWIATSNDHRQVVTNQWRTSPFTGPPSIQGRESK